MIEIQGLSLAISERATDNHNDLYNIEVQFEVVTATLEKAKTPVEGPLSIYAMSGGWTI